MEVIEVRASSAAAVKSWAASTTGAKAGVGSELARDVSFDSAAVYTIDPKTHKWKRQKPLSAISWNQQGLSEWASSSRDRLVSHFLPSRYPDSVAQGYASFARGCFLAGIGGSAAMVLSTQTLLLAVGVVGSSATATTAAAGTSVTASAGVLAGALNWVLKDGVGQLGGVLFASRQSRAFDAHPKQMRMLAAAALDAASFLEVLSPFVPSIFVLPVACVANVLKNVGYLTASASRAALHLSLSRGSLGDVVAKAGSQSMAAGLLGTAVGIGLSVTVLHTPHDFILAWCALSCVHQFGNYRSLQSVVIDHFNQPRLHLVLREQLDTGRILSPEQVCQRERIFDSLLPRRFYQQLSCDDPSSWLAVGSRLDQACPNPADLPRYLDACPEGAYLLTVTASKTTTVSDAAGSQPDFCHATVHLVCFSSATGEDMIRGMYHAYLLRHLIVERGKSRSTSRFSVSDLVDLSRAEAQVRFPLVLESLRDVGWKTDTELTVLEPSRATRIALLSCS